MTSVMEKPSQLPYHSEEVQTAPNSARARACH